MREPRKEKEKVTCEKRKGSRGGERKRERSQKEERKKSIVMGGERERAKR